MSKTIDSRLIGQTIKHLRLSKNWTQDKLAEIAGYSVRNLRRIENDGTTNIDIVNIFADIFDVSAIDILSGDVFLNSLNKLKNLAIDRYQCFARFFNFISDLRRTNLTLICCSRTFTPG